MHHVRLIYSRYVVRSQLVGVPIDKCLVSGIYWGLATYGLGVKARGPFSGISQTTEFMTHHIMICSCVVVLYLLNTINDYTTNQVLIFLYQ